MVFIWQRHSYGYEVCSEVPVTVDILSDLRDGGSKETMIKFLGHVDGTKKAFPFGLTCSKTPSCREQRESECCHVIW